MIRGGVLYCHTVEGKGEYQRFGGVCLCFSCAEGTSRFVGKSTQRDKVRLLLNSGPLSS